MKTKRSFIVSLAALSTLLIAGCGSTQEEYRVTGDYLTGKLAKKDYKAYLGSAPTTLDATISQSAENVQHLANFEDCLVMNDNYGILRKSLAATATRDDDRRNFSFTIKEGIPWMKSDGTQYEYRGTPQYVTAQDFVTTAKRVLNYNNSSEIYYMYTLFINNAWEYYCYTMMAKWISEGFNDTTRGIKWDSIQGDTDAQAVWLTKLVKEFSNADPDTEITGSSIKDIKDFKRVGVSVNNGTLTYTLNQTADFFPTMLTYTPYTPINSHFLAAHANDYGTNKDTILYCGPYLLDEKSSEVVRYKKNPQYWDATSVHLDTVEFQVADTSLGYADMRTSFDQGKVDGFSLNSEDSFGWSMYITGADGTGTIQNPASDLVNSRELDDVTYTYHMVLNTNRSTEAKSYENSPFYIKQKNAGWSDADVQNDILNTNKALKIKEVRKMILDGIDFEVYNQQYHAAERDQYQMNTFTPRGYVYDGNGVDYVDYYYAYYATQKNLASETDDFATQVAAGKAAVGPQQISGVQLTDDEETVAKYPWVSLTNTRERAMKAVDLYNSTNTSEPISLPINVEYIGVGAISSSYDSNEKAVVQSWNERANACAIDSGRAAQVGLPTCQEKYGTENYPYFYMRLSQPGSSDKLTTIVENGRYTTYTGWGWIGDYADPLTYVHCYVTNGEMSKQSGNNTLDLDNWRLSDDGKSISKDDTYLFETYNNAVAEANNERASTTARYQKFAQVEYQLLNDLYVMKPMYMPTQGWSASVSRAAGYDNPTAHYGLADNILKGIWVLVDVPTGAERKQCRELREQREEQALAAVGGNATNGAFM